MIAERLSQLLKTWDLALSADAGRAFQRYYELLVLRNGEMNLTAVVSEEEVAERHFFDSLSVLRAGVGRDAGLCDVGSGAGFPGVPVAIMRPDIRLVAVDSQGKRMKFLEEVRETLSLGNMTIVKERAEVLGKDGKYRGKFEYVTARAVAKLRVLCELCLPFLRPGGHFYALKSAKSGAEVLEAEGALRLLGAEAAGELLYRLPAEGAEMRLINIRKTGQTPARYPRRFAQIKANPL